VTRDEAVAEVQRGLGFRADLASHIVAALQSAQRELEGGAVLPWFIRIQDDPIVLVADQQRYPLPETFIREDEDFGPFWTGLGGEDVFHLGQLNYSTGVTLFRGANAGGPVAYAIRKDHLYFWPIPTEEVTFHWHWFEKQDVLDSNIENAWLREAPDLMIAVAGRQMAMNLRDAAALQLFTDREARWKVWLETQHVARSESNQQYVLGRYA